MAEYRGIMLATCSAKWAELVSDLALKTEELARVQANAEEELSNCRSEMLSFKSKYYLLLPEIEAIGQEMNDVRVQANEKLIEMLHALKLQGDELATCRAKCADLISELNERAREPELARVRLNVEEESTKINRHHEFNNASVSNSVDSSCVLLFVKSDLNSSIPIFSSLPSWSTLPSPALVDARRQSNALSYYLG